MSTTFLAYLNTTDPLDRGWKLLENRDQNHLLTSDRSGLILVSPVPAPEVFTFDIVYIPHKLWCKIEIVTKVEPVFVESIDHQSMMFSHYEYWLSDIKSTKKFGKNFYFKKYKAIIKAWAKFFKLSK